jgi:hypothetical protein
MKHLYTRTPEILEQDILEWENLYKETLWEEQFIIMKQQYPFFRFPWGAWGHKKTLLEILKKYGYLPIWWTYTDPTTTKNTNSLAPINNGNQLVNGGISLLHFNDNGVKNLKRLIQGTQGSQWPNEKRNPGNPWLWWEGQQKAVTLSDLLPPETYTIPIGWKNIPKGQQPIYYNTIKEEAKTDDQIPKKDEKPLSK